MRILALPILFMIMLISLPQQAVAYNQIKDEDGVTALMRAARDGERQNVKALLEQPLDLNAKDSYGWTALTYAAINGDSQIVEALLTKGADVNTKSNDGFTPLMAAAQHKHSSIVKMLIARGTDVNAQDKNGDTALTLAARGDGSKIIDLIQKAGGIDPKQGAAGPIGDAKTTNLTRPVPLNRPEPSYTTKAQQKGIQGTVITRVLVGSDGTVKKIRVIKGLPYGLSYSAMDAAYQMRFKPATKDGVAAAYWVTVEIEFRLRR